MVSQPETRASYPPNINTSALRALYDNLEDASALAVREQPASYGSAPAADTREAKALAVDRAIRQIKKADWRGNKFKEREVRNAIQSVLGADAGLVDTIFEIVKNQREY
jgi:type I restriction enzyme R subunit